MAELYDVAVVGLGAMGAATIYQLARRGVRAVGIDRFRPPHAYGSTHGETRITRQAVGEGEIYVPLVTRSQDIWRELQETTGQELMVNCGFLMIGSEQATSQLHHRSNFLKATFDLAKALNVEHDVLLGRELARRFPQFEGVAEDEIGYFEPGGGLLRPERCVAVQLAEAARLGGQKIKLLTETYVSEIAQRESDVVRIETSAGAIEASRVVVSVGAWTARLLGVPYVRLLRVTEQILYTFVPDYPELYAATRCPSFIRMWGPNNGEHFYGSPTPNGTSGVRIGSEDLSADVDPDLRNSENKNNDGVEFFNFHLRGRMRGLSAPAADCIRCLYTNTLDSSFVIDKHPEMSLVTVIAACSGHGFKHSAAIGELVAQGMSDVPLLRPFSLDHQFKQTASAP